MVEQGAEIGVSIREQTSSTISWGGRANTGNRKQQRAQIQTLTSMVMLGMVVVMGRVSSDDCDRWW